jgi:hypothetical protein
MAELGDFFASVRKSLFGGRMTAKQVEGMETILQECTARGVGDPGQVAYILATAFHETARTMQPVKEYGGEKYLRSKKYWPYFGRGHVQLTWDYNYKDWGKRLGLDLLKNPDFVLSPAISARILVEGSKLGTFTGKKLSDYINGKKRDFKNARRIINGVDKAATIAGYAEKFLAALTA